MDILQIVVKKRTESQKSRKDADTLNRFASRVAKLRGEGPEATSDEPEVALEVVSINIRDIEIPPTYVRKALGDLSPLVASIKVYGLQQPIKVVKIRGTKKYRLVFGKRRLKAAESAGLDAIPCIVELVTRENRLQMLSLTENLHRANLNPLEEAGGYQQLVSQKNADVDEVAKNLGTTAEKIKETSEFLNLPGGIRKTVMNKSESFSFGVLKVLASAFRQSKVYGKKLMQAIESGEVVTSVEAQYYLTNLSKS